MTTRADTYFRAMRQAIKAIYRGDLFAATEWTLLAERHLAIAKRVSDLGRQRHHPKPLPPRPEPAPQAPAKSAAQKLAKKTEPSPVAAPPKPFCPHSRHPAACFCKNDPPA